MSASVRGNPLRPKRCGSLVGNDAINANVSTSVVVPIICAAIDTTKGARGAATVPRPPCARLLIDKRGQQAYGVVALFPLRNRCANKQQQRKKGGTNDLDKDKNPVADAVESASEAVAEVTEQVQEAAESTGVVGATAEIPEALAQQIRSLSDNVASLNSQVARLHEVVNTPKDVPASSVEGVPSEPISETVPETETELPPAQIIPRKPHWFHKIPRIPFVTG